MWTIISVSCRDCGGKIAVRLMDHKPTEQEVRGTADSLGGMHCIDTAVLELEVNDEPQTAELT